MYNQDSFFDLSLWGRIGLILISTTLFLTVIIAARYGLAKQPTWRKLLGSFTIFWLFVWVSPQVYYQYYHLLFEDLPHQWVIWPPDSPIKAIRYLFFQGPQNLSAHSQGLLGWSLLAAPFVKRSRL